ncbi:MAG: hypothetical protein P1P88_09140 [Bacteroidales bacterium]|nr:hypothetical protein [Bacteroidales bacterium]
MKNLLFLISLIAFVACNTNQQGEMEDKQEVSSINATVAVEQSVKTEAIENLPPKLKKYTWQFGMCEYQGSYDASKYTEKQLNNTIRWLLNGEGASKPSSIFNIGDVAKIDREAIDTEFKQIVQTISDAEIVNTPYFKQLKQKKLEEIKRLHLLTLMEIDAYKNPAVLNNDSYSKNSCSKYTNALIEGGAMLLAVWKEMAEKSKEEGNTSAWERYLNEFNATNKMDYARIHVTTFGWWNCVNESIERVDGYLAHDNQFIKLFSDVKKICEEP